MIAVHILRRALTLITAAVALGLGASTSLGAVQVPWATQAGGSPSAYNYSYGVSALPDGSSIVTGSFEGEATFGSTTLISAGGDDVFVAKFLDAPRPPLRPGLSQATGRQRSLSRPLPADR